MVTPTQIAALKFLIMCSKDGNDLAKRILFFLIDATNGFTREVSVTFTQDQDGYVREEILKAAFTISRMMSGNGSTHLHEVTLVLGGGLFLSLHYGSYDAEGQFSTEGQFSSDTDQRKRPLRYTFWLTKGAHAATTPGTRLKTPSKEELEMINFKRPGLYPLIEDQL